MPDRDLLSSLILEHWSRYHPSMLAQLKEQNLLEEVLQETADQFADLLYQAVSVRKMEHHQAWELAVSEFLLPEEPLSTNPNALPPETSTSPTLTVSGWVERMRRRKTI
ncbi:MAG: hypothetical protein JO323_14650 [Acidobacteriia bacterium]|nr:hypothetical protein [Terriglobia bacterium]